MQGEVKLFFSDRRKGITTFAGIQTEVMNFWTYPLGDLVMGHFSIFQAIDTMDLEQIEWRLYNATLEQVMRLAACSAVSLKRSEDGGGWRPYLSPGAHRRGGPVVGRIEQLGLT